MAFASSGLKFSVKGPAAMAATLMRPLGPGRRPPPLELHADASSNAQAVTAPALLLLLNIAPGGVPLHPRFGQVECIVATATSNVKSLVTAAHTGALQLGRAKPTLAVVAARRCSTGAVKSLRGTILATGRPRSVMIHSAPCP